MKTRQKTHLIIFIALAIALNYVGSNIALFLKLPIYLDMVGSLLIALLFGPWLGALTAILSALLSWLTTDIFAIYYAPVAIVTVLLAGFMFRKKAELKRLAILTIPLSLIGTLISASITVVLFKGITSSGSSLLAQIFHAMGMNLTTSLIMVQILTDYLDRLVSLTLVFVLIKQLKNQLSFQLLKEK